MVCIAIGLFVWSFWERWALLGLIGCTLFFLWDAEGGKGVKELWYTIEVWWRARRIRRKWRT